MDRKRLFSASRVKIDRYLLYVLHDPVNQRIIPFAVNDVTHLYNIQNVSACNKFTDVIEIFKTRNRRTKTRIKKIKWTFITEIGEQSAMFHLIPVIWRQQLNFYLRPRRDE